MLFRSGAAKQANSCIACTVLSAIAWKKMQNSRPGLNETGSLAGISAACGAAIDGEPVVGLGSCVWRFSRHFVYYLLYFFGPGARATRTRHTRRREYSKVRSIYCVPDRPERSHQNLSAFKAMQLLLQLEKYKSRKIIIYSHFVLRTLYCI